MEEETCWQKIFGIQCFNIWWKFFVDKFWVENFEGHAIFDILEPPAFQRISIIWVFVSVSVSCMVLNVIQWRKVTLVNRRIENSERIRDYPVLAPAELQTPQWALEDNDENTSFLGICIALQQCVYNVVQGMLFYLSSMLY